MFSPSDVRESVMKTVLGIPNLRPQVFDEVPMDGLSVIKYGPNDAGLLGAGFRDGRVLIYKKKLGLSFEVNGWLRHPVTDVAISRDDRLIAAAYQHGLVQIWSTGSLDLVAQGVVQTATAKLVFTDDDLAISDMTGIWFFKASRKVRLDGPPVSAIASYHNDVIVGLLSGRLFQLSLTPKSGLPSCLELPWGMGDVTSIVPISRGNFGVPLSGGGVALVSLRNWKKPICREPFKWITGLDFSGGQENLMILSYGGILDGRSTVAVYANFGGWNETQVKAFEVDGLVTQLTCRERCLALVISDPEGIRTCVRLYEFLTKI